MGEVGIVKIVKFIKNPKLIINHFKIKKLFGEYGKKLSDEEYLKSMFRLLIGKELNLENPLTFNEKLQWLKLYDRNPLYTKLVDKYEVKKYVASIIGEEYVIPTLGVYDKFDDIDFDVLPSKFVIKCTHDSGSVMICKDKSTFDITQAKKYFDKKLNYNYYYNSREWPYKYVKPRIIIEEYIVRGGEISGQFLPPEDYKFFCFNGDAKLSFIVMDRFTKNMTVTFFDRDWRKLPFSRKYKSYDGDISKPKHHDLMVDLSEKLSKNIPFVRVDFFDVGDRVYFGELTFYPGSGFEPFDPYEYDKILGDYIKLPM